jgi:hypothetical protein
MATANPDDRVTLAPAVTSLLGALRRRIRRYVWLEGFAAAVAWLGAAFWATLAVDWFFEPPPEVRAVLLGAIGIVLVAVLVQLIGRRAFVPISDSNLATVLERRFSELDDSLLTAVELAGRTEPQSDLSRLMLAETCRKATVRVADVDLKKVFNPRPLRRNGVAASLLVLSIAIFSLVCSESFAVWARRTLAFSPELWPRSTKLAVEGFSDGARKVARGADVELIATADMRMPQVPEVVEVRYRTEGGGRGRAIMDRRGTSRGDSHNSQEYAFTFRSVLTDIHFDVVGGDDRVRDLWIQAVDSPTITSMSLDCQLPAYIGRTMDPLPVTGVMQIPLGSRVTVRAGAANKELVRVQVSRIVGDRPEPAEVIESSGLAADRRGFSYAIGALLKDTTLQFTLTDTDGIKSRDPVRLVLVALEDQPPQVAVQLDGIGSAVTPQARIPAVGRVSDDYGVGEVWFEHAVGQQPPSTHPIVKPTDRPTELKLPEAALDAAVLGLKPGQKLLVSVKAADLRDLGDGPNVAASERWLLDVVTAEQLRAMLDARELALRQRFEQIKREMTESRDALARLEFAPAAPDAAKKGDAPAASPGSEPGDAKPGDAEPADASARQRDFRLLGVQSALTGCRKGGPEIASVAEGFDDIRKQFVNNRIDTEELKSRLRTGIAEPLRAIAQRMYPELDRRLEDLQAGLDDAKSGPALRDRARAQADDILLAMQNVLDRMIEMEDFNQAVELLRSIIQMQDDLRGATEQRRKQKTRELLE